MGEGGPWLCLRTGGFAGRRSRNGNGNSEDEVTIAPVHHILPLTTIVRERVLPIKGHVLVHMGQKVSSADVIAEAVWSREHFFLDVSRTFNIAPDAADQLIRCKAGDRLPAGAVIAQGRGLVPKAVKVPREGRVIAA